MKIKHIYLFSSYNINGISTRYRGVYVLNELREKYNIPSTFVYPGYSSKEILKFIIAYLKVLFSRRKDIVVIYQKLYSRGIYTKLLKVLIRLKPRGSIYDTDDADYLRYYDRNIYYFMKHCKMCTVGSKALKEFTLKKNKHTYLLTSPVIQHQQIKSQRNTLFHVGWIGHYGINREPTVNFSHRVSLHELLFPALKALDFKFKLTILGVKSHTDKVEIEEYFSGNSNMVLDIPEDINWLDEHAIYEKISTFDIGVSPMINHEFNQAKSAFKTKQYLSCGVPVVGSPVGENFEFIKDGFNGYLCKNRTAFKQRISQMKNMSNKGYDVLRKNTLTDIGSYSMKVYGETLKKQMEQCLF